MAGDWIKMRKTLLTDSRVVRIMSALNADRFRTIGGLFAAWCLFDEQTEDGILPGYSASVFDDFVGMPGLCEAMIAVGWLRETPEALIAINFTEHNGKTAKRRAQESVRKMSARDADKKREKSAPREEKRREDKNTLSHPLLNDPNFAKEWKRWKAHRIEKQKPVGDIEAETQLMQLGHHSPEEAARIVEYSTSRGAMNLIKDGSHKPRDAQKAPYAQQNRRVPRLEDVLPQ